MKFRSDRQRKAVMSKLNGGSLGNKNISNSNSVNMESRNVTGSELTESQKERFERILRNSANPDEAVIRETELWLDNEQPLYNQKVSIIQNLDKKRQKGIYTKAGGVLAFKNLVDNTGKSYNKAFGFTPSTSDRNILAIRMEREYRNGLYRGTY